MTANQQQQLIGQAQLYQQQMQGILAHKEALNMQLVEIDNALEEIEKSKSGEVYKISGPLLIKAEKTAVEKELKEKRELIDVKAKTMEKSEHKIKAKVDELREQLAKTGGS
ncbi:MAG: prefoldin subunit beta [Candidatus Aenigmarchaeota archaeon]|nr:prefoldin subunit beta [Candidatus Aenigmarchaeota archaeon]